MTYWGMDERELVFFMFDRLGKEMTESCARELLSHNIRSMRMEYREETEDNYPLVSLNIKLGSAKACPVMTALQSIGYDINETTDVVVGYQEDFIIRQHSHKATTIIPLRSYAEEAEFIFKMVRL